MPGAGLQEGGVTNTIAGRAMRGEPCWVLWDKLNGARIESFGFGEKMKGGVVWGLQKEDV